MSFRLRAAFGAVLGLCAASVLADSMKLTYPQTRKTDLVEQQFGEKVADPYRWLEDDNSAETAQWVEEQNKVTYAYLNTIPYRAKIKERLEQLFNYPKIGAPFRKGVRERIAQQIIGDLLIQPRVEIADPHEIHVGLFALVELRQRPQAVSPPEISLGVRRVEADRLLRFVQRLVIGFLHEVGMSHVRARQAVARIAAQHLAQLANGLVGLTKIE